MYGDEKYVQLSVSELGMHCCCANGEGIARVCGNLQSVAVSPLDCFRD
jgi:hypothetical protein